VLANAFHTVNLRRAQHANFALVTRQVGANPRACSCVARGPGRPCSAANPATTARIDFDGEVCENAATGARAPRLRSSELPDRAGCAAEGREPSFTWIARTPFIEGLRRTKRLLPDSSGCAPFEQSAYLALLSSIVALAAARGVRFHHAAEHAGGSSHRTRKRARSEYTLDPSLTGGCDADCAAGGCTFENQARL
jgi:hypothetical protein